MIGSEAEFERLPDDGLWEVVDGRAILLPANDNEHQDLSDELAGMFRQQFKVLKRGCALSTPNISIPRRRESYSEFQNRVPDIAVSKHKQKRRFQVGEPPELVVEILSTRRGNVERTEKLDDYALAGIAEYWIVNPFDRVVEVYLLRGSEYLLTQRGLLEPLQPQVFPDVIIDPAEIWTAL